MSNLEVNPAQMALTSPDLHKLLSKVRRNPGLCGAKIRELRLRRRLTQQECVGATGIRHWALLENSNGSIPRPATVEALESFLGVPLSLLLNDGRSLPPAPVPLTPDQIAYQEGMAAGILQGKALVTREDTDRIRDEAFAEVATAVNEAYHRGYNDAAAGKPNRILAAHGLPQQSIGGTPHGT